MTYKEAIQELLLPTRYLRRLPTLSGKRYRYRLYKGRQTLLASIPGYYYWRLRDLLLLSKDGKYTLSRRRIQNQHGATVVKRLYRIRLAEEKKAFLTPK